MEQILVRRLDTDEVYSLNWSEEGDHITFIEFFKDRIEVNVAEDESNNTTLILLCPYGGESLSSEAAQIIEKDNLFGLDVRREGRITWGGKTND